MSMSLVGLAVGMALAFAGYFGGFAAFLLVAALGAIGFVAGKFLDGDLDADQFLHSTNRGRERDSDRLR